VICWHPFQSRILNHYDITFLSRSPSVAKERTRDELIDSIVHTRTREHRVMPGFLTASSWEERKAINIDCDKVRIKFGSLFYRMQNDEDIKTSQMSFC
jgi:hypothetical protein